MTGTAVDASARVRGEAELRDREERYRLFSQLATDYVYEATVDENVTSSELTIVAGSFERIVGTASSRVVGRCAGCATESSRCAIRRRVGSQRFWVA